MGSFRKLKFFLVILIIGILTCIDIWGLPYFDIPSASEMRFGIDIRGGVNATFYPDLPAGQKASEDDLNAAKKIIDTRLENAGVFDKYVNVDETNGRIIVEIPYRPGDKDQNPHKTLEDIGKTALLTFQEVDEEKYDGYLPDGTRNYLPTGKIIVEGKDVEDARPLYDSTTGRMVVSLTLKKEGAQKFAEATERLVEKPIAIYMDEILISAPIVNEPIPSGEAQITLGGGDANTIADRAKELADTIRAGALPFKLVPYQVNSISPLLGEGARDITVYAGVVSFILVCMFMLIFYRLPGVVADIALFGLVAAQIFVLSAFKISLTLPGIAGIILSVGMGVDANIIISERIREELRSGKTLRAAIDSGYKRAFAAIFDGNITTLITAIVLYFLGTGPVKGFAVTLFMGVILSFLTAVTASKIMLDMISGLDLAKHPWLYGVKPERSKSA